MLKHLFQKQTHNFIGLDIGTRFVKAVLLEKSAETITLKNLSCEPIAGDAFADREVKDFDAVSNALRKVTIALKPKSRNVAVAIAGGSVISKIVQMDPELTDFELEGQIEIEADSLIPYPLEEVYLDFESMGKSKTHTGKIDVLLSAAHKDMVDSRITLLREVEFEPKIMDIEGYALGNALRQFYPGDADAHTVCLNLGASLLQVCVLAGDRVVYSKEHNFGFDNLVNDLSIANSLDKAEVQKQLLDGTLPENWRDTTYPIFLANLQQQISRAMQMYISTTHAPRPQSLVLSGGGANLPGLADELATDLAVNVSCFDPFADMKIDENLNKEALLKAAPQFAIATGLASRSFDPCHI